ncbi:hypothetical protein BH24BAC1_BH24BAC1_34560 [soil metagenome]
MKNTYNSHPLKRWVMGAAIVSSVFTMYSCTKDITEDLTLQAGTSSTDATALAGNNGDIIPGKYIVVLKEGEARQRINSRASHGEATRQARAFGQEILRGNGMGNAVIEHAYGSSIAGFSAALTAREAAQLRADSRVAYIEPDRVITLSQKGKPGGGGGSSPAQNIPWGITEVGGAVSGAGKVAWVIDSGIDLDHPDLNVDVARSITVFTSGRDASSADDGNGHGTHVAGTIAALDNTIGVVGVAHGASVVAVKVLDSRGSGSYSGVITGVNYVAANGEVGQVANMSLGGPASDALDAAVVNASAKVKFVLAAGNDGAHAKNSSPARAEGDNIYTISAMDINGAAPSWSNYGDPAPVDYCTPGVSISSTWKDGGYNTISGTSMAAPHMAGILLVTHNIVTNGTVTNETSTKRYGPRAKHK